MAYKKSNYDSIALLFVIRILSLIFIIYFISVEFFPKNYNIIFDKQKISAEQGRAFFVEIKDPRAPLVTFRGDGLSAPRVSSLTLTENGRLLGPAHSLHADIRQGGGGYSHWGHGLIFSSSDGSDPILNGRTYVATVPAAPTFVLDGLALVGFFILFPLTVVTVGSITARVSGAPEPAYLQDWRRSCRYPWMMLWYGLVAAGTRLSLRQERLLVGALAIGTTAFAWGVVYKGWASGQLISDSLSGFLPISDAGGYYTCASGLVDLGHLPLGFAEWCSRRPIYSSLLASFIAVSGNELHAAFLLQAAVVSFAIAAFVREVGRLSGVAGTLLTLFVLVVFANQNVYPVTLSENAGLALGAVALALLLRGAEIDSKMAILLGTLLLTFAESARSGCLFVLPLLVLWAGYHARIRRRKVLKAMIAVLGAILLGFGANFMLLALNGMAFDHAGSNFSLTLYGLAVGGKGWGQFYIDHPEITSLSESDTMRSVYQFAFDKIVHEPSLFLGAFVASLRLTIERGIGLQGGAGGFVQVLWWLWVAGFVPIALRFRESRHALIGCLTLGGLLSGPFIVQDGGDRVFAATIGIDAAQASLGLGLLCQFASGFKAWRTPSLPPVDSAMPRTTIVFGIVLIAAIFAVYTPLRYLVALPALSAPACPSGEAMMVTRLGRESLAVSVLEDGEPPQIFPPRTPISTLLASVPSARTVLTRAAPYSIVFGLQRLRDSPDFGSGRYFQWFGDLTAEAGKTVRICYDADKQIRDELIGGVSMVRSITPVGQSQEN